MMEASLISVVAGAKLDGYVPVAMCMDISFWRRKWQGRCHRVNYQCKSVAGDHQSESIPGRVGRQERRPSGYIPSDRAAQYCYLQLSVRKIKFFKTPSYTSYILVEPQLTSGHRPFHQHVANATACTIISSGSGTGTAGDNARGASGNAANGQVW